MNFCSLSYDFISLALRAEQYYRSREYFGKNCQQRPNDLFAALHPLPSPTLVGTTDKYKKFEDVYGTTTTEKDRPSL